MKEKKEKKEKTDKIDATLPVYDLKGEVVDNFELDGKLFDGKVNLSLLYEANKMFEANKRQGTVSTKTRAEVAGGGIKPWRQKGTGRARVGSTRNPLWRHGGVCLGPKPRSFKYRIPQKSLSKALLSSLNARLKERMIKLVIKIELEKAKTKNFTAILENLKVVPGKVLVIVNSADEKVKLSSRNIEGTSLREARNVNARDVLLHQRLLIEKDAFSKLAERLK